MWGLLGVSGPWPLGCFALLAIQLWLLQNKGKMYSERLERGGTTWLYLIICIFRATNCHIYSIYNFTPGQTQHSQANHILPDCRMLRQLLLKYILAGSSGVIRLPVEFRADESAPIFFLLLASNPWPLNHRRFSLSFFPVCCYTGAVSSLDFCLPINLRTETP